MRYKVNRKTSQYLSLLGSVNATDWRGHPAGTLRATHYSDDILTLEERVPGGWQSIDMETGQRTPLYREVDFNEYEIGERVQPTGKQ